MPRGVKKENLPTKICVTCNRPFTWRKKWESVWDEVTTCSKSCNRQRRQQKQTQNKELRMNSENSDNDESYDTDRKKEKHSNEVNDVGIIVSSNNHDENSASIDELNLIIQDDLFRGIMIDQSYDEVENDEMIDPEAKAKAVRKAEKKRKKQERRLQREGCGDPSAGQKQCHMCSNQVDLLIRCTYDETLAWKMVCGKCWKVASGGVVDGDASHPHYRYGGLWKNRRRR